MTSMASTIVEAASQNDDLVAIVGQTASGKTALAIDVAIALNGEIVSADSVQIYREFNIGSGKPTAEELSRAKHYLIDALNPLDTIDAAGFAKMASACVDDIRARGKRPIVCGGTFLWVKALLFGLAPAPPGSDELRAKHRELVEREGAEALHAALAEIDPEAAARLHANDIVRVSRALEVHTLSGRAMTEWQREHAFATVHYPHQMFAIAHSNEELTKRIEARVTAWLEEGWIAEVESLIKRGYENARAMSSVGYHEVAAHVKGELPREELAISIVRATRVFARRQKTWLNSADVTLLSP